MPSNPRFVVDSMLGHVARWLRLLGYDTLYYRKIDDWKLLKIAKNEDRILITRDQGLFNRAKKLHVRTFFVEDPDISVVLAELSARFNIQLEFNKNDTRCPNCNTPLRYTTSIIDVAHRVSKNIVLKYKEFWLCPSCKKVYWQGNHWKTITEVLEKAKIRKVNVLENITIAMKKVNVVNTGNNNEPK
ncbi:Mut7-C RNAse domain-containing protein [Ignisphaera sp. 4213-co]|uniref:Mut7-C RNAse domain-containing protein n=1 Tax=Ignisphaera cupida TaxID=3050454 RepID=A0ABD4Z8N6_9CREN|nr:Mut7-C RNAse domain-containing protein [Ignisphaera sp. 4213-co]MDK6029293.1 Mut7-C RNAse domain-containing protein [Ignisphaera sp. 4213-co]